MLDIADMFAGRYCAASFRHRFECPSIDSVYGQLHGTFDLRVKIIFRENGD